MRPAFKVLLIRRELSLDSRTQIHTTRLIGMFALMLGLVLILVVSDLLKRTELTLLGIAIVALGAYFYFYRGKLWVDLDDLDSKK